jgi:hypothetical protein
LILEPSWSEFAAASCALIWFLRHCSFSGRLYPSLLPSV